MEMGGYKLGIWVVKLGRWMAKRGKGDKVREMGG
jgi:hypothetical protein